MPRPRVKMIILTVAPYGSYVRLIYLLRLEVDTPSTLLFWSTISKSFSHLEDCNRALRATVFGRLDSDRKIEESMAHMRPHTSTHHDRQRDNRGA